MLAFDFLFKPEGCQVGTLVFPLARNTLGVVRCDDARRYKRKMKSDLHGITALEGSLVARAK